MARPLMRLAIISDIHGNLVALETVLASLAAEEIDDIVCLGDVAAGGPQPHGVVERLKDLAPPVVMGNADAWLLNPRRTEAANEDVRRMEEIDVWCAAQLSHDDREYLRTFQPTVKLHLGDGAAILCFHGSPHSNKDIIVSTTPTEDLERLLAPFHATAMAGGHTHVPMVRRHKDMTLLNPGSVGLPYEQAGDVRNPPWTEYALVTWRDGALSIELRRVAVDVRAVVQAALESDMPHRQWWAKDWR